MKVKTGKIKPKAELLSGRNHHDLFTACQNLRGELRFADKEEKGSYRTEQSCWHCNQYR